MFAASFCRSTLVLVALAVGGWAVAGSPGDRSPATPHEGVLVLHGGQVLQGRIARADDVYRVVLPRGEIRIRASEVAYQCETIEEAYGRRRATIHVGNADEHIELARWCQRNGLWSAAARELADAMASDPTNPAIPYLERQLSAAMAPAAPRPIASQAATSKGPTNDELDRMIRQMPAGSVEAFTSSVQPLLVNSCTSGGCHGPQSSGRLRLLRGRSGHPPSRRVTQRNLHAALACIDRKQPENSPLLVEAIRAHGTVEKPVLAAGDVEKYRQIVLWVRQVAAADRGGGAPSEAHGQSGPAVANVAGVEQGADGEGLVPDDPFDPEIFNRRYHGEKQQAGEETEARP